MLIASLEVLLIALGIQILCWLGGKILFEFAEPGKKKVLQYATIWRDCCTHPAAFL